MFSIPAGWPCKVIRPGFLASLCRWRPLRVFAPRKTVAGTAKLCPSLVWIIMIAAIKLAHAIG
jgi:hypothetical protein